VSNVHIVVTEELGNYIRNVSLREPEVLRRLREETAADPVARMQILPEMGQFLGLLMHLLGAKKTLEVGTYTGYSSTCVALALPENGKLIACDVSEEWTSVARRYWKEAGVAHKIDLRIAPALQTMDALIRGGQQESFDFAFIDADKANYANYYERALLLLRRGGLIAVDNVLWSGRVLDPASGNKDTDAIRAFNERLHGDDRVWLSMLPVADGLTLACKR
jgi:caffeoyl-CoA O-methyltransferase